MDHTQAIILSIKNFRENDKIINFYTKDFGKKEILATGSRKINSKLNPHLQYFAVLEISFIKGRNLDRLTNANLKINYSQIKLSLKAIALGEFCLETVNQLTKSSHPDKKIFDLLTALFDLLSNNSIIEQKKSLLVSAFLVKLLSFLGYTPELYICLKCKNKIIEQGIFFSFKKGGSICPNCHQENSLEQPISAEAIKILRLFLSEKLDIIRRIKLAKRILTEVNKITINFLKFHLDRPLNSEQFLKWTIT